MATVTPEKSQRLIRLVQITPEAAPQFGYEATATEWKNARRDLFPDDGIDIPTRLAEADGGVRFIGTIILR